MHDGALFEGEGQNPRADARFSPAVEAALDRAIARLDDLTVVANPDNAWGRAKKNGKTTELRAATAAGDSFRAADHAEPEACTGLTGRCPECIALYLVLAGPKLPVCIPCGHKHWPWEDHADHQWRDACPYEGTACRAEDPIGVHGSDGSLAYPDDPMPVNVRPFGDPA